MCKVWCCLLKLANIHSSEGLSGLGSFAVCMFNRHTVAEASQNALVLSAISIFPFNDAFGWTDGYKKTINYTFPIGEWLFFVT